MRWQPVRPFPEFTGGRLNRTAAVFIVPVPGATDAPFHRVYGEQQ